MEINEDVKIEHGLRTTTLAKFFFFHAQLKKSLMDILFWKINKKIAAVKHNKSSKQT